MKTEAQFRSERDFVAQRILPEFKEAAKILAISDVLDFHFDSPIEGAGIADLYAERAGKRMFVVEAKFKKKVGHVERDIEPRDPEVIDQALRYANHGRFLFYLTCNANRMILYQLQAGKTPLESEVASFDYHANPDWAVDILRITLGQVPIQPKAIDDSLVDTLREAFDDLYPEFASALKDKLGDKKFQERYDEWLQDQGLRIDDETNKLIAEQSCYLELNKLVFYQVIRTIYPNELHMISLKEEDDVSAALSKLYEEVKRIDYAPIYETDVVTEIPLTHRAKERLRTLIDTLNEFNFAGMESDFLGRVYEKLIPPLERKRLGQFYTPPAVVDFITALTIGHQNSLILDPGCGSGSFLVRAYQTLRRLNGIPRVTSGPLGEEYHKQLLSQIYGMDINQFPAHLSVINLAIQNPQSRIDHVNVVVKDFFDIKAGQATLSGFEGVTAGGAKSTTQFPSAFDVVVANPPYIRQELLSEKEKRKIIQLVEEEYGGKVSVGTPRVGKGKAIVLDKQSDIYLYFFIHALALLKTHGRLGFISSNKWLEVGYGEQFQQFLLNHTRIHCVVEFDKAVFPDADVNTAVTILEKEGNERIRNDNLVKFVRIKQEMNLEDKLRTIKSTEESFEDDRMKVNVTRQRDLSPGKWNVYLRAPPVYEKISRHQKTKSLGTVADVVFGLKTGYNPFFVLSKADAKERRIEAKFLKPILYSPKEISGLALRGRDVQQVVFSVHDSKSKLKGTKALSYIEYGEKNEVEVSRGSERTPRTISRLESVRAHKPFWYSIPRLEEPDILLPKFADKKLIAILNEASVLGSDLFYYVTLHSKTKDDVKVVYAFINSSVGALLGELYGRSYGGGVLDIKVYEAKQLPVIDPASLTREEKKRIVSAIEEVNKAADERNRAETEYEKMKPKSKKNQGLFDHEVRPKLDEAIAIEGKARKELDEVIFSILSLTPKEKKQIEDGLKELQEIRRLRTQAVSVGEQNSKSVRIHIQQPKRLEESAKLRIQ